MKCRNKECIYHSSKDSTEVCMATTAEIRALSVEGRKGCPRFATTPIITVPTEQQFSYVAQQLTNQFPVSGFTLILFDKEENKITSYLTNSDLKITVTALKEAVEKLSKEV